MPFTLHFILILPATSGPHSQGDSPFAFSYSKEQSFKMPLKIWLYEKKPRLIYDLQVDVLSMGTLQVLKVPSMMSFYTFLCTFLCSWSIIVAPGVRLPVVVRCCYRQRYFKLFIDIFFIPRTLIYKKLRNSEGRTNYPLAVHLNAKYGVNTFKPHICDKSKADHPNVESDVNENVCASVLYYELFLTEVTTIHHSKSFFTIGIQDFFKKRKKI